MKCFVVVALLVASVAAQQNLDFLRFNRDTSSLFKTGGNARLVEDLLLKEKLANKFLSTEQQMMTGQVTEYPSWWGHQQVSMMTLEEITSTQLFRQYYNIPLFRQFWEEHPVAFMKYVQSVLFQQFWTVPAFQQYFMTPALFYKYIVPQVQLFAQKSYSTQGEIFKGQNWYSNDKYSTMEQLFNKPTYTQGRFDYGRMMNLKNMDWTVPSMINSRRGLDIPSIMTSTFGGELNQVNYKFLLDKIYSHLNKLPIVQGGLTETLTEVRELPTGQIKEQTVAKMVDPITGQEKVTVGDIKMVDETIVPATVGYNNFPVERKMNTMVDSEILKEFLLKKYYLNKMFGGKKMISNNFPYTHDMSMFETLPEHLTVNNKWVNPIVARMYGLQGQQEMMNKNYESFSPIVKDDFITKYQTEKMIKDFQTEKFIKDFETRKMIKDIEAQKMIIKGGEQEIIPEYNHVYNMYNTIPKMDTLTEEMKLQRIPLNYGKPMIGGSGLSQFEKEMLIKDQLKY